MPRESPSENSSRHSAPFKYNASNAILNSISWSCVDLTPADQMG